MQLATLLATNSTAWVMNVPAPPIICCQRASIDFITCKVYRLGELAGELADGSGSDLTGEYKFVSVEPYLHGKIAQIVEAQLRKLREGTFPIADSVFAYGVPDPSGTLEPGTLCVVLDGYKYLSCTALVSKQLVGSF